MQDVGNMQKRSGVMVRGRWLPASEIDARLAKIAPPPPSFAKAAVNKSPRQAAAR
jgi:hypothetical protein